MALSLASSVVLFLLCERWYFLLGSHRKKPAGLLDTAPTSAEQLVPRRAA
jgi:hypothetical protein